MTDHPPVPVAAVIGAPISHSLSPRLHNYWLRRYGITGYYVPLQIEPEDLETTLRAMPKAGFVGCNVTIPHKEAVLKLADVVTDRASLIGAANTLVFRRDGKIYADNTDGYGFVQNLMQGAPSWVPESGAAMVLGAGGASRGVVASLLEVGVPEVRITNRTRPRAEAMKADFGARVTVCDWVHAAEHMADCATVVNTSSLGMVGQPELNISLDRLPQSAVVTDIVYAPLRTAFLEAAAAHGCATVDGLGMLLHQAAPGFERWFGHKPEVDAATRAAVLGG